MQTSIGNLRGYLEKLVVSSVTLGRLGGVGRRHCGESNKGRKKVRLKSDAKAGLEGQWKGESKVEVARERKKRVKIRIVIASV